MAWQRSATSHSDPGGYRLSDLRFHVPRFAEPLHPATESIACRMREFIKIIRHRSESVCLRDFTFRAKIGMRS